MKNITSMYSQFLNPTLKITKADVSRFLDEKKIKYLFQHTPGYVDIVHFNDEDSLKVFYLEFIVPRSKKMLEKE